MEFELNFIFERLPCYIYWLNNEFEYESCNGLYAKLLGIESLQQIKGKDFLATHAFREKNNFWNEINSNNVISMRMEASLSFKETLISKEGELVEVLSKKAPLFDSMHKIIGLLSVSFIQSNEELLVGKPQYCQIALDNIVANLPGHIYCKNKEGVYLVCNDKQARSLGLNHGDEVVGKTDFDLPWEKSSAKQFRENDLYIMKKGKQIVLEEEATFEGKPAIVLSYKSPLKDRFGHIVGILGISLDITARKKAEEALQKANNQLEKTNQAKAKFLKVLQHDLRNKLTGILSFSELLLDFLDDKEQLKSGLTLINRSGMEILPTLDKISHYLSLEIGQLKPYPSLFDLTAMLQQFQKEYQKDLFEKGLKFECNLDPKVSGRYEGDYALIFDVVDHLIKNAIKYTNQGTVALETRFLRKAGDTMWLDIVITDTGCGMSKEVEKNLFKLFDYDPNDKQYTNPGINLSISKKIALLLGGDLLVDSFEGKGTTFTFYVKLKVEKPIETISTPKGRLSYEEASNMGLESSHPVFEKNKFLVLIVEDDATNREALSKLLSTYFYSDVLLAPNLKTAKQQVLENWENIDLILTDIQLPDGEGQELIPYLYEFYPTQEGFPWIVAVTAFSRDVDVQHFIEKGVIDVISKPITLQDLSSVIISLFGTKVIKKIHLNET
jgi:two-component system aerobic respiration control sensor histidine kinase ArcB